MAGFRSEQVAGFLLECMAGFVGIRISFDRRSYKQRHRIENAFCRLKDFRRIATRYDRLARNFMASICLVAAIVWWVL